MYELFQKLLDSKGIKASVVSRETGIPYSTFSDWKAGRYTPKADKLKKIADYFGISVNYFLCNDMNTSDDSVQTFDDYAYYDDPETAKIVKQLRDNPELSAIFNAYSNLEPEDAQLITDMIWRMSDGKRKGL